MIEWWSILLLLFVIPPDGIVGDDQQDDLIKIYMQLDSGRDRSDCYEYTDEPYLCRQKNCYFNCATRICEAKSSSCAYVPTDSELCEANCFDICSCRKSPSCDYDIASGECRSIYPENGIAECREGLFEPWECVQKGMYYIEAGSTCKMTKTAGNCSYVEVIHSVNFNGKEVTAERGILYLADVSVPFKDPHNTRLAETFEGNLKEAGDLSVLYSTFIRGAKETAQSGRCLTYVIPIAYVGFYELTLRMAEFRMKAAGQRFFTVMLNNFPILEEFDFIKAVGSAAKPADFTLAFEIDEDGFLHPKGFDPSKVNDGRVPLSFCYGGCAIIKDSGYIASAFHVLRLRTNEPSAEVEKTCEEGGFCTPCSVSYCRRFPGDEKCNCPEVGSNGTEPATPDEKCQLYKDDLCGCKNASCQFNIRSGECRWGGKVCAEIQLTDADCRRKGTFTSYAGVLCLENKDAGNCDIEKDLNLNVNIGGDAFTDSAGLKYREDDGLHLDSFAVKTTVRGRTCENNAPIKGINPKDEPLYTDLMYGKSDKKDVSGSLCVTYALKVSEIGRYLLTIKAVELFWKEKGMRAFSVHLNAMAVLPEVDLVNLKGYCTGADFLVNFNISEGGPFGTRVVVSGHPPSPHVNELVILQFCYSRCTTVPDASFISSAFSVVKLVPLDGSDGGSTTSVTETSELTTITADPESATEGMKVCSDYDDVVDCKYAGCGWIIPINTCTDEPKPKNPTKNDPCPHEKITACTRKTSWYSQGGLLCKTINKRDAGSCKPRDVVIAININGKNHVDSNGILHSEDSAMFYTDRHRTRQPFDVETWKNSQCKDGIKGIPKQDRNLYTSAIVGRTEKRGIARCIAYHAKIINNGRYEFNVRTVETYWSNETGNGLKPRQFNIALNNQIIFPEVNILHRVDPCQGMSLVTQLDVLDGMLTPAGLAGSRLGKGGRFDVEFCFGGGAVSEGYDPNYLVSSFYIVRLASGPMPNTTTVAPPPPPPLATTGTTERITTVKPIPPVTSPTLPPVLGKCQKINNTRPFDICQCIDPGIECEAFFQVDGNGGGYECVGGNERIRFCEELDEHHQNLLFPGGPGEDGSCRRARGTYSYGGLLCNMESSSNGIDGVNYTKEDTGYCRIRKQILGIRFHGDESYTDDRGIVYEPMDVNLPDEPADYVVNKLSLFSEKESVNGTEICHSDFKPSRVYGKGNDRENLWKNYATGYYDPTGAASCFNYTLHKVMEDGTYELMIKTSEFESTEKDYRAYNIYLNEIRIFAEIEPRKIWGEHCVASELVAVFVVSRNVTIMTTRGFQSTPIRPDGITVSFCQGQCKNWMRKNFEFTGVAFSVVQFNSIHTN